MQIRGINIDETWLLLLKHLIDRGDTVEVRDKKCFETLGMQTSIDMKQPILTVNGRNLGYRFLFAEAWWILTGRSDVASIQPYSKQIKQFSDNGTHFFGAYGPKILDQLNYVVSKLGQDIYTRQAIINIWRENPPQTKDYPCTLSVQFLVRGGKLYCIDTMRSSDAWLGWPYDTFNFSMLSSYIILALKEKYGYELELGNLIMTIGSSHLYDTNLQQAYMCFEDYNAKFKYPQLYPNDEWVQPWDLLYHLQCVAEQRHLHLRDSNAWCHEIAEGKYNK